MLIVSIIETTKKSICKVVKKAVKSINKKKTAFLLVLINRASRSTHILCKNSDNIINNSTDYRLITHKNKSIGKDTHKLIQLATKAELHVVYTNISN